MDQFVYTPLIPLLVYYFGSANCKFLQNVYISTILLNFPLNFFTDMKAISKESDECINDTPISRSRAGCVMSFY